MSRDIRSSKTLFTNFLLVSPKIRPRDAYRYSTRYKRMVLREHFGMRKANVTLVIRTHTV